MTLALPVSRFPIDTPLVRVVAHSRGAAGALHFGPNIGAAPGGRFDSAVGSFRVCYLAVSERGAFAESLLRRATLPDPDSGIRAIALRDVAARSWARTSTTRRLRLADVRGGDGLSALGVTGALTMSESHLEARAISDRIHALTPSFDGIHFRARFDPNEAVLALFDRATDGLTPVTAVEPLLSDLALLGLLLDHYRLALDE